MIRLREVGVARKARSRIESYRHVLWCGRSEVSSNQMGNDEGKQGDGCVDSLITINGLTHRGPATMTEQGDELQR